MTRSDILNAALGYSKLGWRVHPLRSRSKLPRLRSWQKRATVDTKTIREWWGTGNANLGIATGPVSQLFVLDVDGDVNKLLRGLEVPPTAIQRTGGGGAQFFFRWVQTLDKCATTRAGLLTSIDSRGAGGYVVAPPSVHPNGGKYRWLLGYSPDEIELAEPPVWLIELLQKRTTGGRTPDSEWRQVAGEPTTKGARNTTLARLAGHLFSRRDVDPIVARELLLAWSQARCTPPMNERQALRTIQSIAEKELRKWQVMR